MKHRISICLMLCCILVLALLPGCGYHPLIEQRLKMLDEKTPIEEEELQMSRDIVRCFSENDVQGLKTLLCQKTRELTDIDEQILEGFDFVEGSIISFDEEDLLGSEGESVEYGKTTRLDRSWSIKDIKTDAGEVYKIYIRINLIYEEDKNREGITQITVIDIDGEEIEIGYPWPDYYIEGSQLSYEVINALSENDWNGLREVLCESTLEAEDIDSQIQAGFDFFEGKATFGKVGMLDGHELYDGDYDYHTTVVEVNIQTDTGEIYELEFYAYLLYTDKEAYEGISQIKIISDDGRELIIGTNDI